MSHNIIRSLLSVILFYMIISNSLSKKKEGFNSASNLFHRTDGFRRSTNLLNPKNNSDKSKEHHTKLHTSNGYRKYAK